MPFWVLLYYFIPCWLAVHIHDFLPSVSPYSHSNPICLCFVFCYHWLSVLPLPSHSWLLLPCGSCLLPHFLCMPFCFCSLLPNAHYLSLLKLRLPQRRALMGWASQYPVCAYRGFEELGDDQGKTHDYRALLSSAWTWLHERGRPLEHRTVQRLTT